MLLRYRALDEVGADRAEAVRTSHFELTVGLAGARVKSVDCDRQLARKFGYRDGFVPLGMDQFAVRPEARGGPAVLLVDPALRRVRRRGRRIQAPLAQRVKDADERGRSLERR